MASAPNAVYAALPATTLFPRGTPASLYDALFLQEVGDVRHYVGLSTDNNFLGSKVHGANMLANNVGRLNLAIWANIFHT